MANTNNSFNVDMNAIHTQPQYSQYPVIAGQFHVDALRPGPDGNEGAMPSSSDNQGGQTSSKHPYRYLYVLLWILVIFCVVSCVYLLILTHSSLMENSSVSPLTNPSSSAATMSTTASPITSTSISTSSTTSSTSPTVLSSSTTTESSGSVSSGSVVQMVTTLSHTKVVTSTSGSWIEPSADYRVSITPKYIDSEILVTYNFGWNGYSIAQNTLVLWSAAKSVGGSDLDHTTLTSSGSASNDRNRISGVVQRRNNGYDGNDMNFCHWVSYDYPETLEAVTYGLHMFQESPGAGSIKIGESSVGTVSNGWTWTAPVTIIAMEVRNE
mmetsp:Transcript_19887/g.31628  ORF Transcript_19887/g.31628 Transcript_19887/m.31628 type:complete len:325 (+) Transcript_19887:35-1009(+)